MHKIFLTHVGALVVYYHTVTEFGWITSPTQSYNITTFKKDSGISHVRTHFHRA